ncbi:MAG: hypothetical protein EXR50_01085 [Dehalococcoidia bacterium]|nr:hypothetical protein [Dehalococcoidia bacterium]
MPTSGQSPEKQVSDEVVVRFRDQTSENDKSFVGSSNKMYMYSEDGASGVIVLKLPVGQSVGQAIESLSQDPRVAWAEPNYWYHVAAQPLALMTPNDLRYAEFQKKYLDLVNAEQGWSLQQGNDSVVIAVLDTGVACAHPDLAANIWQNPGEIAGNGVDDDRNDYIDDFNGSDFVGSETGSQNSTNSPGDSNPCVFAGDPSAGNGRDDDGDGDPDGAAYHGTAVAGIIAAVTNNSLGVAGICWRCKIMAVRVMNPEGSGRSSDLAKGILYAAKNGAKIINISGGGSYSQSVDDAIQQAYDLGATIIASAGNDNSTPMAYPASSPRVVGVSATSLAKGRASFSSWGSGSKLTDIAAPGIGITSTVVCSVAQVNARIGACLSVSAGGPAYALGLLSGTSFSAPIVSGVAGLILSQNASLINTDLVNRLNSSASPLQNDPNDRPDAGVNWAGAGMVDMAKAMGPSSVVIQTPTATPVPTTVGGAALSLAAIVSPPDGMLSFDMGPTLNWTLPQGATQYQIQILPFNNDGPSINLVRNAEASYAIGAPQLGVGNYVMLPGMTYTWRIRTTNSRTAASPDSDAGWSDWTGRTFRTAYPWSGSISPVTAKAGETIGSRTPTLVWKDENTHLFYYEVQVSRAPSFNTDPKTATAPVYGGLVHGGVTTPLESFTIPSGRPLEADTTYYWRVRARVQGDGTPIPWSDTWFFNTRP